jgi:hypothetical protein
MQTSDTENIATAVWEVVNQHYFFQIVQHRHKLMSQKSERTPSTLIIQFTARTSRTIVVTRSQENPTNFIRLFYNVEFRGMQD